MAQFSIENLDVVYEEIISTVTEDEPDVLTSNEIYLQTFDSLKNAVEAIKEFEQCTSSNYIILEKQKHFGNEAFRPKTKITVHWEGPVIKNVCLIEYSGVPFIIVGRKVLGCHLGKDLAGAQKKRYAESRRQKETTDGVLVHRRKPRCTKKMNCPAKIYIYHILNFPDFQIKKKTIWQTRSASRKLKSVLENIELKHQYIILFPHLSQHSHHPVDGKVPHKWEKIDLRVIEKIAKLFENGISKTGDMKRLVNDFVCHELFVGQDPPVKTRRFFPTTKDIANIMRRCADEHKRSVMNQNTILQLFAQWQQENPDHGLYCRPHGVKDEGKTAANFMRCYQSDDK